MTEETTETDLREVYDMKAVDDRAETLAYVTDKLMDNIAFFACLGAGIAGWAYGLQPPDWLVAIIGMGAVRYLQK